MARSIKGLLDEIDAAARAYDASEVEAVSGKLVEQIRENIASHPQGFVKELEESVRIFDRTRAEELCSKLLVHLRSRAKPYPFAESKKILGTLRRKRYFDLITEVADVLIQTGQDEPNIRRQYAQALLDQGFISVALDVLQILEGQCLEKKDDAELAETRGLIGRARKQIYMDAAAAGKRPGATVRQSLEQAISAYAGVYVETNEHIWHGINTVALLERAKRDKVTLVKTLPDTTAIARDILERISSGKKSDLWDCASAGEACLALKDYPQALQWILKYTQEDPCADAFEYASTLRQFEEVWELDGGKKRQAQILHLLRAALLRQEGGQVEIDNPARNLATAAALEADKQFEQILGKDRYKTFQWYRKGLERATGVAQVLDRSGNGQGSGFLVRGADVHESIGEGWVVVTNAHVISDDPAEQSAHPAALPADEARICFEAKDPDQEFAVEKILFSSPRTELDCTIVSLQSPVEHAKPFPIARRLPVLGKNQRVYIIGHPRGGGLSYSIDDNLLLDHERSKLHYRAPTEGGSSGSPVFNQQWDLLALHHAGGMNMKKLNGQPGSYPANEGLYFQSIRDAVAAKLG
ncbi:MAG: trypsin-like peptidase domain-containing protein [Pseudomonadota bacterium]|nr:trypsin-like peptidase domain-containing protein [Pseudomonadota bacterium]